MLRIGLAERAERVPAVSGRLAAVAVPRVLHPAYGECLVVTRRASVNGHTGRRISHAGDVVLFGGSVEPGESPAEAAARELREEAGTPGLSGLVVGPRIGTWLTERGIVAEGYALDLPESFVAAAHPDAREVAEVAYLRVADVRAAPIRHEYHRIHPGDHPSTDHEVWFESPTLRVPHAGTGEEWMLWGLAGHMVGCWGTMPDRGWR